MSFHSIMGKKNLVRVSGKKYIPLDIVGIINRQCLSTLLLDIFRRCFVMPNKCLTSGQLPLRNHL